MLQFCPAKRDHAPRDNFQKELMFETLKIHGKLLVSRSSKSEVEELGNCKFKKRFLDYRRQTSFAQNDTRTQQIIRF
jgi:hypothetical protein